MHTRTALRTRVAATAAVLAGITLSLSACGGPGGDGMYQLDGWDYLKIDGDTVTTIEAGDRSTIVETHEAVENDEIDLDSDVYDVKTGTLNDDQSTVIWNDGGDVPIEILEDKVQLDGDLYIDYDSDEAKAQREEVADLAE